MYYHGGQSVVKALNVVTAATDIGKTSIIVNGLKEGSKWYYMTAAAVSGLTAVTAGSAITVANWTELTENSLEITPANGHTVVRVVEVDASNKPIAVGDAILNIGE